MGEAKKKPRIRFTGFDKEWTEIVFSDIFDMLSNNTLSRENLNYESGEALNVHYGDILTKFGEFTDVIRDGLPYISDPEVVAKYQGALLRDGDIVIADTAEDEAVGKCTEIQNVGECKVISGLHTMPCRPKENFAPSYMGYYLNSIAYQGQLKALMQGIKVLSISKSGINDTRLIVATEEKEQRKIGEFLSSLDEQIKAEEQKENKLHIFKKAMVRKLYAQEGNNGPEVRFAGFCEEWKQYSFGDFTQNVGVRNKDNFDLEPYAVTNDKGFISQKDLHDSIDYMRDIDRTAYNIVPPNSFAYNPARINVGSIGYYDGLENVIVSSLYEVFQTAEFIDDRFIWHWIKSDNFPKWVERLQEGSVRLYFYYDKLVQCNIKIPSFEEQRKIGEFLDEVDRMIELHHAKLEKLKNIKSACMEKMFV